MDGLIQVNKFIGENIKNTTNIGVRNFKPGQSTTDTPFTTYRKRFCQELQRHGYETKSKGNYVIAMNGKETITFFFAAHNSHNKNYLIAITLTNEVNYFAFYNDKTDVVYLVGYGIVRKYCKSLNNSYTFYNDMNNQKLFIPDEWAKQQKINTYLLH